MATPVYSGGNRYRRRGYGHRRWGQAPGPTGNGWLDQVGSWFGGVIPPYAGAGQPTAVPGSSGSPVYMPAPSSTGNTGAAFATPQVDVPVLVAPPR